MKILIRGALALGVLFALFLAGVAIYLPGYVKSDAVREELAVVASDALGAPVGFEDLDVSLIPLSLIVVSPTVGGASPEAPRLFEARSVSLHIALLPLLARTLLLDSLSVDGSVIRLRRTSDGVEILPESAPPEATDGVKADAAALPPEELAAEEEAPFALALRKLSFEDATIVFEDIAVSPPVTWQLEDVDVQVRGSSPDEPLEFELAAALASGGKLTGGGTATLGAELDAAFEIEALDIALLGPYLAGDGAAPDAFAGRIDGTITAVGPAAAPQQLRLLATLSDGDFALNDIRFAGPVRVQADLSGDLAAPSGSFGLDATEAELHYADTFTKPAGTAATVEGRIETRSDGTLGVDDVKLKIRNFEAEARVDLGRRTSVSARFDAFDLDGWGELVPALAPYAARGQLRGDALEVHLDPLELGGSLHLDRIRARVVEEQDVAIDGALRLAGDGIRSVGLTLTAAEQIFAVDVVVAGLADTLRYELALRADGADMNRLVGAFAGEPDFFFGSLELSSQFSGSVADGADPLEALIGQLRFDIGEGRLAGVSLLESAVAGLKGVGAVADLASRLFGGPALSQYYGDEFESMSGTFDLAGGGVTTDDLNVVYRGYAARLDGDVGLLDLSIDMAGRLELGAALSKSLGARDPLVIPLASITGTLDEPQVGLNEPGAEKLLRSLASDRASSEIEKLIDSNLDGDSPTRGVLEGILGGGRR